MKIPNGIRWPTIQQTRKTKQQKKTYLCQQVNHISGYLSFNCVRILLNCYYKLSINIL